MSFLEKVFKKEDEIDINEFLNNLDVEDEQEYVDADAFVKSIVLAEKTDADTAVQEVKAGNIILLNVEALSKRNALKLRELVSQIKGEVVSIDGDIARISQSKILLTPNRVKIMKRK